MAARAPGGGYATLPAALDADDQAALAAAVRLASTVIERN
jgi:hypothetical protein